MLSVENSVLLIIDIQEGLEILKLISPANILDRIIGKRNAVFLSQVQHQFRFKGAFDVDVQFRLGNVVNKRFHFFN